MWLPSNSPVSIKYCPIYARRQLPLPLCESSMLCKITGMPASTALQTISSNASSSHTVITIPSTSFAIATSKILLVNAVSESPNSIYMLMPWSSAASCAPLMEGTKNSTFSAVQIKNKILISDQSWDESWSIAEALPKARTKVATIILKIFLKYI